MITAAGIAFAKRNQVVSNSVLEWNHTVADSSLVRTEGSLPSEGSMPIRRTWDSPDSDSIFETDITIVSRDIANTHDSNAVLSDQESVKEFFKLKAEKILPGGFKMSEETLEWLGELPYSMGHSAIPLFGDPVTNTDYQIHPAYPRLPIGTRVPDPNLYLHRLHGSCEDRVRNVPDEYVIPLGRLFVNMDATSNAPIGFEFPRISRWTGYEVFIDLDFIIWIVFNNNSLLEGEYGWYPVACRLCSQQTQPRDGEESKDLGAPDGSIIDAEPFFRAASLGA